MVAQQARRAEKENKQYEAANDKFRNFSMPFHRFNDLTAEGRSGLVEGWAKSPTLEASAVAVVKIADCVS
jgi:hypothetical protein